MNSPRHSALRVKAPGAGPTPAGQQPVSPLTFALYIYFLVDFFLHLAERIPGYGILRPTLLEVALLAILLFIQRDRFRGRAGDPIFKAVLIIYAYVFFTLPFVEWPGSVLKQNLPDFVKATVFLFFTALIVDTEKRLKIFLLAFVSLQLFRVLEPLFLNLTQGYWGNATYLGGEYADRLSGAPADVINSNGLGFVVVTVIPFLHYFMIGGGLLARTAYCGLLGACLYTLILTMSRGGFIALLVVGWMIFYQSRHKALIAGMGLVVAVAGWSVMSPVQKDRYLSLVSSDTENAATVDGRWDLILKEFQLGFERPLFGHGLGTTPEAKANILGYQQASHNLYGEILIELGLIGAVLFLRMLYLIYRRFKLNTERLKQLDDRGRDGLYKNLNLVMVAVFWMYVVYSLNYYGLSQYYWYLFGGLAIASGRLLDLRIQRAENDE